MSSHEGCILDYRLIPIGHSGKCHPVRHDDRPPAPGDGSYDDSPVQGHYPAQLGHVVVLFRHAGRPVPDDVYPAAIQDSAYFRPDRDAVGHYMCGHSRGTLVARTVRPTLFLG